MGDIYNTINKPRVGEHLQCEMCLEGYIAQVSGQRYCAMCVPLVMTPAECELPVGVTEAMQSEYFCVRRDRVKTAEKTKPIWKDEE